MHITWCMLYFMMLFFQLTYMMDDDGNMFFTMDCSKNSLKASALVALFKLYSAGVLKEQLWYVIWGFTEASGQRKQSVVPRGWSAQWQEFPNTCHGLYPDGVQRKLQSNRWHDIYPWEPDSLLNNKIHALTITEARGCLALLENDRGGSHLWL